MAYVAKLISLFEGKSTPDDKASFSKSKWSPRVRAVGPKPRVSKAYRSSSHSDAEEEKSGKSIQSTLESPKPAAEEEPEMPPSRETPVWGQDKKRTESQPWTEHEDSERKHFPAVSKAYRYGDRPEAEEDKAAPEKSEPHPSPASVTEEVRDKRAGLDDRKSINLKKKSPKPLAEGEKPALQSTKQIAVVGHKEEGTADVTKDWPKPMGTKPQASTYHGDRNGKDVRAEPPAPGPAAKNKSYLQRDPDIRNESRPPTPCKPKKTKAVDTQGADETAASKVKLNAALEEPSDIGQRRDDLTYKGQLGKSLPAEETQNGSVTSRATETITDASQQDEGEVPSQLVDGIHGNVPEPSGQELPAGAHGNTQKFHPVHGPEDGVSEPSAALEEEGRKKGEFGLSALESPKSKDPAGGGLPSAVMEGPRKTEPRAVYRGHDPYDVRSPEHPSSKTSSTESLDKKPRNPNGEKRTFLQKMRTRFSNDSRKKRQVDTSKSLFYDEDQDGDIAGISDNTEQCHEFKDVPKVASVEGLESHLEPEQTAKESHLEPEQTANESHLEPEQTANESNTEKPRTQFDNSLGETEYGYTEAWPVEVDYEETHGENHTADDLEQNASDTSQPYEDDNTSWPCDTKEVKDSVLLEHARKTMDALWQSQEDLYETINETNTKQHEVKASRKTVYENVSMFLNPEPLYENAGQYAVHRRGEEVQDDESYSDDDDDDDDYYWDSDFSSDSESEEGDGDYSQKSGEVSPQETTEGGGKLKRVAEELLTTEKAYVKRLHLIFEVFNERVALANEGEHLFPADVIPQIFANIQSIYQLHKETFLPQLDRRLAVWDKLPKIGDLFRRFAPFLKMYSEYVRNFDHSMNILRVWQERSKPFADIINEIHRMPECGMLTLQHHMLEPIQRVPRYELLLKDYLKELQENSEDRQDVEKALESVTKAAACINDTMRQTEKFRKLLDLKDKFGGAIDLIDPSRELIKEGKLVIIARGKATSRDRYLFLFSDMLLICKSHLIGPLHRYHIDQKMDLAKLKVLEGDTLKNTNSFYLKSKIVTIEIRASSDSEKSEWMSKIGNAITELASKKRTSNIEPLIDEDQLGHLAPTWVKDEYASMCQHCGGTFSVIRRRHHCRCCGLVVCAECSSKKLPLPYLNDKPGRVCKKCFQIISGKGQKGAPSVRRSQRSRRRRAILKVKGNDPAVLSSYLWISLDKKTWERRWFAVHATFVLYSFKAPQDIHAKTTLPLPGCQMREAVLEDHIDQENAFIIFHTGLGKTYYFYTDDSASMERWMRVLHCAVIAELPPDLQTPPPDGAKPEPPLHSNDSSP